MDIKIAREVAARIWCDQEMSSIVMDVELVEEIAQLLASRLTPRAADVRKAGRKNVSSKSKVMVSPARG